MTLVRLRHLGEGALRKWQPRLLLRDWQLTLLVKPEQEIQGSGGGPATVTLNRREMRATVYLNATWWAGKPDNIRDVDESVVHELLHCHLDDVTCNAKLRAAVEARDEFVIDRLTRVLVEACA